MRPPNAIFTAPLRPGRNGRSWPGFRDAPEGTGDSHLQEPIRDHLFGYQQAFAHPLSVTIVVGVLVGLAVSGTLIVALRRLISETSYADAFRRWRSWCWLVGVIFLPVLAGALWTMLAVMVLSLLCFREYARATGLFREKTICAVVALGIVLVTFAAVDHWQDDVLFFALGPLVGALIVIVGIPADRPKGFIQRVALGVLGFALLGFSLGYISNMANVSNLGGTGIDYRPLILLLIVAVELNDLLASLIGRTLGHKPILPKTNPRKTWGGAIGAAVLTTSLVAVAGGWLFRGTPVAEPGWLIGLGLLVSLLGQLGDLTLASIKRDVGIEDVGATLPGHGGLLDRFDGLVLVPPAVYHYLSLALGDSGPLGSEGPHRILTGGWGG